MRYERLKISKPIVKAVLASEKHVFWASQTSFMLQSTAKSSAMVPRMIWDHVVFGPKIDQKPGVLAKTLGGGLQNSSNCFFWAQKHSKTLKNTQKHSKILKNTPNMPETTLVTPKGIQGSLQNSKFRQKHENPYIKVQKRLNSCFRPLQNGRSKSNFTL